MRVPDTVSLKLINWILDQHEGQLDKAGKPYSDHLFGVAQLVPSHLYVVALAHDILEDTDVTAYDLDQAGMKPWQIELVEILTLRKGQRRDDYLRTIRKNQDAACVKIADVLNNVSRLHQIENLDERTRLAHKYQMTMEILVSSLDRL